VRGAATGRVRSADRGDLWPPLGAPGTRKKGGQIMHVDCDDCAVRGPACSGCVVTVLLGAPPDGVEWDETERAAIGVLADSGLVPPLRLVPALRQRKRAAG